MWLVLCGARRQVTLKCVEFMVILTKEKINSLKMLLISFCRHIVILNEI
jgi:hypothetical protein